MKYFVGSYIYQFVGLLDQCFKMAPKAKNTAKSKAKAKARAIKDKDDAEEDVANEPEYTQEDIDNMLQDELTGHKKNMVTQLSLGDAKGDEKKRAALQEYQETFK